MFDSNEIAEKALRRADEIKAERKRRRSIRNTAILCCVCVFVATLIISPYYFRRGGLPGEYIGDDMQVPLWQLPYPPADESAETYKGAEKTFLVPAIEDAAVPAGATGIVMNLYNPAGNIYCFAFSIILPETGEYLYSSGLVGPGMCVENPTLSRALDRGGYNAVLRIAVYDGEDRGIVNSVDIGFSISVT